MRLTAYRIQELDDAASDAAAGLQVYLNEGEGVDRLASVFKEHGTKGQGRVSLIVDSDFREIEMELPSGFRISPSMRAAIKAIPGIVDVRDL